MTNLINKSVLIPSIVLNKCKVFVEKTGINLISYITFGILAKIYILFMVITYMIISAPI